MTRGPVPWSPDFKILFIIVFHTFTETTMSTETSMTRHPNMAIRYAPAVSDFPWYNGILLTTGSMQEEIKELISEKPNVSEGELIIIQVHGTFIPLSFHADIRTLESSGKLGPFRYR
jgi:hypothetical protein